MLWTAEQAEAWMRANPGRWLEDCEGTMWVFDGLHFLVCPVDSDGYGPSVTVALTPTEAAEDNLSLTFHPPREHWAAEVERLCADAWRGPVATSKALGAIRALFRAAPEVDGG